MSFGWQGGEPTLCGLDFFRRAVAYQRRYGLSGQRVANAIQTNGLLLDDGWAEFFRDSNSLVGLSIDGPSEVHDAYRRTLGGRPTDENVMRAVDVLTRNSVAFNLLTVVTKANCERAPEVYRHLRELGQSRFQFLPCVELDPLTGQPYDYSISAAEHGRFLIELFDVWVADDWRHVYVRTFNDFITKFVSGRNPFCVFNPTCGDFAVVEHNGDVYACDVFVEPAWLIGNLLETPRDELWVRPRFEEFRQRKTGLDPECRRCQWLELCYGGCPKYRIYNGGETARDYFCDGYRAFLAHAEDGRREMAAELRRAYAGLQQQNRARRAPAPVTLGR